MRTGIMVSGSVWYDEREEKTGRNVEKRKCSMESMGIRDMNNLAFFKGKKVFLTGHTGFKGSWLSRILTLREPR